ncbi:MAG: hypothetical protein GF364_05695 [Candidatus Lokiarchaeota archaeon]|nr:hypothetical protein [Candidatus Lokiarchaeota archaeon]
MSEKKEDIWESIPSSVYIALGRRGQESIATTECWMEGCDNKDEDEIQFLDKEISTSDKAKDGSYFTCTKITVRCKKCNQKYKYALKMTYIIPKDAEEGSKAKPFMGMLYILDENDKNLGFAGYC